MLGLRVAASAFLIATKNVCWAKTLVVRFAALPQAPYFFVYQKRGFWLKPLLFGLRRCRRRLFLLVINYVSGKKCYI